MARVEGEMMIQRPVEEVFDFVADERNEPRYNPRMLDVARISDGPIGLGTRFRAELKTMGRTMPMTIEFTAYERPWRLASLTRSSMMETEGALTFETVSGGTRMRWSWDVRPRGVLGLMTPIVGAIGRREERSIWCSLKRFLESQGTGAPSAPMRASGKGTRARCGTNSRGFATRSKRVAWGATDEEQRMQLPGDDLVPQPLVETTHAITIDAPPERVWPWLVQIGQGRAGFYSDSRFWDRCVDWYYRRLSGEQPGKPPVGYDVKDSEQIVTSWQDPSVGDIIADGPPGTAYYVVRHVEPNEAFVLFTDTHLRYLLPARLRNNPRLGVFGELSDSLLMREPEPGKTRVVRRMRMRCGPWPFRTLAVPIVLIWGDEITARNFLRGVKRRAERTR
jgi:uncharacterized protein YndB with AHSA1/START domain